MTIRRPLPQTSRAPSPPREQRPAPAVAPPLEIGGPVPWSGRRPTLAEVEAHLGDCQRCGLCEGRSKIVFGDGNPDADLLFIGEGPGAEEDKRGTTGGCRDHAGAGREDIDPPADRFKSLEYRGFKPSGPIARSAGALVPPHLRQK